MINKFLKSPFGFATIWLISNIIYTMTTTLLWASITIEAMNLFIPFLVAYFYTSLIYKKTMNRYFKCCSLGIYFGTKWILGIIERVLVYPNQLTIVPDSFTLPHLLILILIVGYLFYLLITFGNYIAVRLLSKTKS